MAFPAFFADVPGIRLRDPLAAFLGASDDGTLAYGYADAVRLAGHSCPTVASAYWLTRQALSLLYPDELPERGGIGVALAGAEREGVNGVVANVAALLTGATGNGGFKGLAGRFSRRNLLAFEAGIPLDIRFARRDGRGRVDAKADLRHVPAAPEMNELMQRCLSGAANAQEAVRFGELWQDRVRRILLEHGDDPAVFVLRREG